MSLTLRTFYVPMDMFCPRYAMTKKLQFKLMLPEDVKAWLAARAERNLRSQGAEIVACLRERMATMSVGGVSDVSSSLKSGSSYSSMSSAIFAVPSGSNCPRHRAAAFCTVAMLRGMVYASQACQVGESFISSSTCRRPTSVQDVMNRAQRLGDEV